MVRGDYDNSNRTLVNLDYDWADQFNPDGTGNPQISSDDKISIYGDYSPNNFPGSSSSRVVWIAYCHDIDSTVDGKYFWLDWDGVNISGWAIRNNWREFQILPNQLPGEFNIKIEPNFTDVGWSGSIGQGVGFTDVPMPAKFSHHPSPSANPESGVVYIDWLYNNAGTVNRAIPSWFDYNEWDYTRYDILARPYTEKWKTIVGYDFGYWVCIQNHTHVMGDSSTEPYFGSPYWQKVENTI